MYQVLSVVIRKSDQRWLLTRHGAWVKGQKEGDNHDEDGLAIFPIVPISVSVRFQEIRFPVGVEEAKGDELGQFELIQVLTSEQGAAMGVHLRVRQFDRRDTLSPGVSAQDPAIFRVWC